MRSRTVRIEYKSRKRKTERYLSLEECRTLLSVMVGRDHLIVRMFIQFGLRPEVLFALRRNDVGKGFIRIDEASTKGQIKETKTEESAVNVYVPPDLIQPPWIPNRLRNTAGLLNGCPRSCRPPSRPLNADARRHPVRGNNRWLLQRTCP